MISRYSTNRLAVLILPKLDKVNNYNTIVRNPKTEVILKINPFGYDVLKIIDENPDTDVNTISLIIASKYDLNEWQIETKINNFIENMVSENIILKK